MSYNMFWDRVTYSFWNARPYKSAHQCHCTPDRGSSSVKHVTKQIFSDAFFLPSFSLSFIWLLPLVLYFRREKHQLVAAAWVQLIAGCLNVNIWISEWACKYIWGIIARVTDSLCWADSGTAGCGLCIRWPWWLWSVWTRIMRRLLTKTRWNR